MHGTGDHRRPHTVALLLVVLLVATSCGRSGSGRVLVSAAASLTDAFGAVEAAFEQTRPGTDVTLNLGGSSMLREQILNGAPADVYASANAANMEQVVAAGDAAGKPQVFAHNLLQIAVPPGNPAGVTGLSDFSRDDLLIGLCAEDVPCGAFADQAFGRAGVVPAVDTREPDVRALLTKIEAGELDAGIVYATDVASAHGGVDAVDIPETENVVAEYWIARIADAPSADGAEAFIDFVLSDEGQTILRSFGFLSP